MATIVIMSEDPAFIEMVQGSLPQEHHTLYTIPTLDGGTPSGRTIPELLILDLRPYQADGPMVCRRARAMTRYAGSGILCVVGDLLQQPVATILDSGGDDCLRAATLNQRELAARARALLRRAGRTAIKEAPLVLISQDKSIRYHGQSIELTPTEFDLLDALSRTPGDYLSASQLLEQVWKYPPGMGDPALVRNHVRNIRRKLETDPERPKVVTSAHGRGYTINVHTQRR
jgi:two-component system response regulator RpaA